MNLSSDIWKDDNKLRAAFSWLTRIGAAPKFGTMPIHYYQQDQCAAIDAIVKAAGEWGLGVTDIRCKQGGLLQARAACPNTRVKWHTFAVLICGKITPRNPSGPVRAHLETF